MRRFTFIFAVLLGVACHGIMGCGASTRAVRSYPHGASPRFEFGPCTSELPDMKVDCGTLIVPESRTHTVSREVRVAIAILRSGNPAPDSIPAFFLSGGPGAPGLTGLRYLASRVGPVLDQRDVIVMDNRGVGKSLPVLGCGDSGRNPKADFLSRCRNRLLASGIDPESYRSVDVAADIADLAMVLGYRKLALIGSSYGTRVAFTILRDYPALPASAVLDAATPPQVDLYESIPATADRAFTELQRACAEDPDCVAHHPDLGATLDSVLARLAAISPEIILRPGTGKEVKVRLTSELFVRTLMQCFSPALLSAVPALIDATSKGEYGPIAAVLEFVASQPAGRNETGTYQAVQCAEEMPFNSAADAGEAMTRHPRFAALSVYARQAESCARWSSLSAPDPREDQPVGSPVPVLFMSGRFDPIGDPAWADAARETLANSRHVVFPNAAHGALHQDCGGKSAASFIAHPGGDLDGCLAELRPPLFLPRVSSAGILCMLKSGKKEKADPSLRPGIREDCDHSAMPK